MIAAPAFASDANPASLVQAEANTLAPGDYLWKPRVTSGPLSMVVDLTSQHAFVYRDGTLIAISTISSGKPGHETPTGTFTVLEKYRFHRSNKYEDAPMPYMQRLGWDGLALHAGHPHGYPASHGCIRLPPGFAAALFKEQTKGMQVVITGHTPSRAEIRVAAHENAPASPQCCEANASTESDNLQATKYWSGPGYASVPVEAPEAQPVPPPDCAADRDPADQADANDGDVSRGCDNAPDRGRYDPDRGQDVPPPDLPPPPG